MSICSRAVVRPRGAFQLEPLSRSAFRFAGTVIRPLMPRPWVGLALAALASVHCAGSRGAPPPPPNVATESPGVEPPRFEPGPARSEKPESRSPYAGTRGAIFEAAWSTVRDKHYDPGLGGLDWTAMRKRYEPMALLAPDEPTFYRVLNDMLGELKQSHLSITGPGDEAAPGPASPADAATDTSNGDPGLRGDPGLTIRIVGPGEGEAVITAVRPGSSAARAGLTPGTLVLRVGGHALAHVKPPRALRPIENRFYVRRLARRALEGPAGSPVTVTVETLQGTAKDVVLKREAPSGPVVQVGNLGPLRPQVTVRQLGDVGYVAFNLFLLDPVLQEVTQAIDQFRARKVKGLILDLRGNPGGVAAMAIPLARAVLGEKTRLGTLHHRDHDATLVVDKALDMTPYLGPVVLLTDEGTASTSEIFAAALQEAGRAKVVGSVTLGQALPSVIEALPGGAVLQYVVADFRTPKGIALEGRGVIPDRQVLETRAAFEAGHDPVLEAGLELVRRMKT
ncbi:MAG: hypothetical protein KA712_23160 [Myxococcales bacterium]|nr:hypothetical protein [Myxococcales bacterium]